MWCPVTAKDSTDAYQLATVKSYGDGKEATVVFPDGKEKTVKVAECHRHDPSHDEDYEDAGNMGDLHEAPLLKLLGKRHARDAIYTWSGHILISVNPYHMIPRCARHPFP